MVNQKPLDIIELKLCSLLKNTKNLIWYEKIPIDIDIMGVAKMTETTTSTSNPYWKAGTGYGVNLNTKWDISMYIDTIKSNMNDTINILNCIIGELEKNIGKPDTDYHFNTIYKYIYSQFTGITLLDFNKMIDFFHTLIKLINVIIGIEISNDFIERVIELTDELYCNITTILTIDISSTSKDNIDNYINTYIYMIDTLNKIKTYQKAKNISIKKNDIPNDIMEQYKMLVASEQYNSFDLTKDHLYYSCSKSNISRKTMLRIVTETSSLKNSLPNNWDSSIMLRIPKTNINLLSFIITGPKDTPYHNGIFEFHVHFPDGYPSVVPQVLINTTDGGKVRFNPNLYANGKVCLSLLGTWSGEAGESWNPDLSSFLQILISIQSLILVDMPYFNEPGYEKTINTPNGKAANMKYNDNIRLQTIRVAMIGNIKKKIPSYENFITNHFKLKKDEILETVNNWLEESIDCKVEMKKYIDELTLLL